MPPDESSYNEDWLNIAEKDWKRVQMLLEQDDPALAGFCLQQSIEKFLKAYLLSKGWYLRRIHDLDTLLEDAIHFDPSLKTYQEACQKITAYYMVLKFGQSRVYPATLFKGFSKIVLFLFWEKLE